ncbi:MAG: glycosyltransferase family 4 protein [Pelobium sp.]
MSAPKKRILFLTLKTFGFTGGIEKMCRVVCRALYEIEEKGGIKNYVYSMYDRPIERDSRYTPNWSFQGFAKQRIWFVIVSIWRGMRSDTLLLSHVNLLFIGFLIRLFRPSIKIYLFAHGIEIWPRLGFLKRYFLKHIDILAVSQFTKDKIILSQGLQSDRIRVLNNALDPFYEFPTHFEKPQNLIKKYHLKKKGPLLFTLTRLASTEKYKGYDIVIEVLPEIIAHYPNLVYMIGGKYDKKEKQRLDGLIAQMGVQQHVQLSGFIDEIELTDHFLLADLFIMPSKKEGFGIVFIEAMASGLATIAGNLDGSTDALKQGELGLLVDPENKAEIKEAILKQLKQHLDQSEPLIQQQKCRNYFGFEVYRGKLEEVLLEGS